MVCTTSAVFLLLSIFIILPASIVCPPVTEKPSTEAPAEEAAGDEDVVNELSYQKYLREVMTILMADKDFSKKVIEAGGNFSEKSGEIARHLDFVGHGIRTKLDEIKRKEVDRLRQIIRLQMKMQQGMRGLNMNVNLPIVDKDRLLAHLDHNNPNTFEIEDLSKLIKQATTDLEEIDEKRRKEFKNYEMEKELLRKQQLEQVDGEKRIELEKEFEQQQQKHAEHPKVHHPGNEAQLKEVWEESDGLNKKDFDPRTFFYLHDTNGDGHLDESEIEALFQKELDKVYDPNAPEDDMMERYEEMNRMREHIMEEVDKNNDSLLSLDEFLDSTKNSDFKKEEGWDTLEKQKIYTDEELAEFERQYEELKRQQMLNKDHLQPQPPAHPGVDTMVQGDVLPSDKVKTENQQSKEEVHAQTPHKAIQPSDEDLPVHPRVPN